MPPKKNPLENARKRLKEKLDSIKEQSEYIKQVINDAVSNATCPAKELLNQKDRKKFFAKYSSVSQDLEKCLDFLLLLSDSVSALNDDDDDDDEQQESSEDEDDDSAASDSAIKKDDDKQDIQKDEKERKDIPDGKKNLDKKDGHGTKRGEVKEQDKNEHGTKRGEVLAKKQDKNEHGTKKVEVKEEDKNVHGTKKGEVLAKEQERIAKDPPPLDEKPPNDEKSKLSETTSEASMQSVVNPESQTKSAFTKYQAPKDERTLDRQTDLLTSSSHIERQTDSVKTSLPKQNGKLQVENKISGQEKLPLKEESQNRSKKPTQEAGQKSTSPKDKNRIPKQKDRASPVPKKKAKEQNQGKTKAEMKMKVEKLGRGSSVTSSFQERKAATSSQQKGIMPKVQLTAYPVVNGASLEVIVTEVLSPWELWMQPISTDFDLLMEKMCMEFAKAAGGGYKGGLSVPPSVGDYCCARFTEDDTWYRARVTAVHQTEDPAIQPAMNDSLGRRLSSSSTASTGSQDGPPGIAVEVLCVDDGNRETLPLSRLRPLPESFSSLPCQALCCALSGIQPVKTSQMKQGNSLWDQSVIDWLRNKVSGTKLQAYPSTTSDGALLTVQLFHSCPGTKGSPNQSGNPGSLPGLQFSIAHQMVNTGLAQFVQSVMSEATSPLISPISVSNEELPTSNTSSAHEQVVNAMAPSSSVTYNESGCEYKVDESVKVSDVKHSDEDKIMTRKIDAVHTSQDDGNVLEHFNMTMVHDQGVAGEKCNNVRRSPDGSSVTEGEDLQPTCLKVMMAEVVNPSEFYVHLITPEAGLLDILMDELQDFYQGSDSTIMMDYCLGIGDYCCAKFTDDGRWYRAQVSDVKVTPGEAPQGDKDMKAEIQVFYIDFGNTEWVEIGETRPLLARFMMIPGFAVKCRLAGLQPVDNQDDTSEYDQAAQVNETSNTYNSSELKPEKESSTDSSTGGQQSVCLDGEEGCKARDQTVPGRAVPNPLSRPPRGRAKKKKTKKVVIDEDTILRAAGDESYDSDMSETALLLELPVPTKATSSEAEVVKDVNASALPEKYLLPSPEKEVAPEFPAPEEKAKRVWSSEATELFKGLTGDDKTLMGLMVPWNPRIYHQVFCSVTPVGSARPADITFHRPMLSVELYDTTEDEDIHINQVLLDTGLAEACEDEVEDIMMMGGHITDHVEVTKKVKLTIAELENIASTIQQSGSLDSSGSESPTEEDYRMWDPMMDDYRSSRNSYRTDVDDVEVAILGYKSRDMKVCRFYKSKNATCWKGDNCTFLHLKEGEQPKFEVQAYCNNVASSVELPDVGTWVAVRVTAILNPGHFWVQFPYGAEPIEKKIIEARTAAVPVDPYDEDEDLDAMMKRMNNFYSRNLFREGSSILPAMGELSVAKCGEGDDALWYRALVTDLKDDEVQVSLVDYGNSAWVPESCVKRMLPQFLHLPFQAVECLLANVEAAGNDDVKGWSKLAGEVFESMAADKILIAQILSSSPANNTLYLDLFNTEDNNEVHINEEMISQGFAKRSKTYLHAPREREQTSEGEEANEIVNMIPG